jgi:quercetin dioxygenase-like cupin family protein
MLLMGMLLSMLFQRTIAATNDQPSVRSETLLRSGASWDGQPYESYPSGRPELTILRISLLPHTQLGWHSHPMPSAAYIVVGELTLERKKDGKK